ncbi:MAG: phosphoribosylformylglycinamidine synthase subunit PurQ [Campylobacterales bacterium]|nr:phosphoribosylformylglycinamidine synthase subunit PurQ [Campylobacterales bacterium]
MIAILQFAGTNCEYDTKYAFEKLGQKCELIWHKNDKLPENTDLVVVPGGFSYGDYLRSGAIARFSPIMKEVVKFANSGGNVLGICNGFQILVESHLLPGAMKRNDNLHFISKFHKLKVVSNNNKFLRLLSNNEILNIPIAHAEGNFYINEDGLKELYDNEQVILKYCDDNGCELNPNGATDSIAGVCNKTKNVFGLMPHPERAIDNEIGSIDGINMLKGFLN